jgi:hypothetical protein
MDSDTRTDVLYTYRSLRLATVVIVVLLFVAVIYRRLGADCWQTSISAYYFTPVHAVFVGSLCAVGLCLVVYQGSSDTEDATLNLAGLYAFIVAVVPVGSEPICGSGALPAAYDVSAGVRNNVVAVLVAAAVAELLRYVLVGRAQPRSPWARRVTILGWLLSALGVVAFVGFPEQFQAKGHDVAAVAMFVGIIGVVVINALSSARSESSEHFVRAYQGIAALMALTLAVILGVRLLIAQWSHVIIWVEVLLILEFVAFWLVQTMELWDVVDRREKLPEAGDPTGR